MYHSVKTGAATVLKLLGNSLDADNIQTALQCPTITPLFQDINPVTAPARSRKRVAIKPYASDPRENKLQKIESTIVVPVSKRNEKPSSDKPKTTDCCESVTSFKRDILTLIENEFTCCICEEIVIKATVTKCNHMFCAYCLKQSKKRNTTCPLCRTPRIAEHSVTCVDEYITNTIKMISEDLYTRRLALIEEREAASRRRTSYCSRKNIQPS